jgi:hypothetical protein
LLFHYKDARVHCAVLKKRAGPAVPTLVKWFPVVRGRAVAEATDPSGPNSVLGAGRLRLEGSTPPANRWLY